MNPDTSSSQSASPKRIESIAYYILLATIVLAPLAFWASPYVALDLVKTAVIGIGSLVSAILFGIIALDERRLALPPKSIAWTSSLIAVSLIISSLVSIHAGKSLFGQGFEIGTASFILATFVGALAAFTAVSRRLERGVIIYLGIVAAYVVLYAFHLLRFIFGPHFASFGILSSLTATVLGSWYALAAYSAVVLVISLSAIKFLPLSGRMRISYWALAVLSAVGMVIINDARVWAAATLLFLGMTVWIFVDRGAASAPIQGWFKRVLSRVSWVFLVALIVSAVFAWRGASIAGPVISKLNAGYTELTLPWQMTLDVTAGAIKNYPIFGVGPNHFSQAYLAYKPAGINQTDAWGVEFSNGFGTVPTFVATQGLTGAALWILFFVFFVILGLKALKRMPSSEPGRFLVVSSFWSSALLWLIAIASTPPHAMLFLTLVMTGIFFGSAVSSGALQGSALAPVSGTRSNKMFPSFVAIMILVLAIWGVVIMKKTVALSYFAAGVKQLTVDGAPANADADFAKALAFDSSDVYWQARAEATMSMATKLAGTVNAQTAASTSQAVLSQVVALVNQANGYAQKAVAYDPTNYYNYISEARVSALGTSLKMDNAYDSAVAAYTRAIALNPQNPSIYLSLAQLQASQNKLDDATKTLGAALQVKNNYLDAVYLLSQVYAAKGDLQNAITAAQVAIQLNPQNALLYFQLGLLEYNAKNYNVAGQAMAAAIKIQPDYANAKYFLGLADARLGDTADAVAQFADLAKSNPDNQEVSLILTTLQAGKPIFSDQQAAAQVEKPSSLPLKEKTTKSLK